MSSSKALAALLPPPPPKMSLKLKPPEPVPTPRKTKLIAKIAARAPKVTRTTRRRRGLCRSKSTERKRRGSLKAGRGLGRAAWRRLRDGDLRLRHLVGRSPEDPCQQDA